MITIVVTNQTSLKKYHEWIQLYLDIVVRKFEIFGLGRSNFFSSKKSYFLRNLLTMGSRHDMQVGNTQKQHKEHVQNHVGKKYQPHFTLGRSNSWFQILVFVTKKPFTIVPKNS